jgi:hypothetical protein
MNSCEVKCEYMTLYGQGLHSRHQPATASVLQAGSLLASGPRMSVVPPRAGVPPAAAAVLLAQ